MSLQKSTIWNHELILTHVIDSKLSLYKIKIYHANYKIHIFIVSFTH